MRSESPRCFSTHDKHGASLIPHSSCSCACVCASKVAAQAVGSAALIKTRNRSLLRAPNHRYYPDPLCCATPALRPFLFFVVVVFSAVPLRLAWRYHTVAHAFRPSVTRMNARRGGHYDCASDSRTPPPVQPPRLPQELIVCYEVKVRRGSAIPPSGVFS